MKWIRGQCFRNSNAVINIDTSLSICQGSYQLFIYSLHTNYDFQLLLGGLNGHHSFSAFPIMAEVTVEQRMLAPTKHLIPSPLCPGICVCPFIFLIYNSYLCFQIIVWSINHFLLFISETLCPFASSVAVSYSCNVYSIYEIAHGSLTSLCHVSCS
jgi:hypothetical protein